MAENINYSADPEDFYYMDVNIPCQRACPVDTNIPAYIRALFEKQYDQSYGINRSVNILPGVLGRICSRPCEDKCRHGESELGDPVNICHIKRAASDYKKKWPEADGIAPAVGKKVAIIGSGPAGLAAANDLAMLGFTVTIYEAMQKPGGMLMYGIPVFRLPRHVLNKEIEIILNLGVTLKTGVRVGSDISIEQLLTENDALLSATGCYNSISLNIPGEDFPGVHSGLEFMMKVCSGKRPAVGEKVLVIGAGFTAFDCARTSLRLGAKDVRIALRRTEEDLRVTRDEIIETKTEGIKIESLMLSKKIIGSKDVEGVEFIRTQPGELREDGKTSISPIEGSEFVLDADTVIVATGQRPGPFDVPGEKDRDGILIVDGNSFKTTLDRFYVSGDYLTGPSTVIESISMGRRAAHRIFEDLMGKKSYEKVVRFEDTRITDRNNTWNFTPRQGMPTLTPIKKRLEEVSPEVETGYSEDQAYEESKRCYLCYLHYEIDMDKCIYCRYCIDVAPRDCIKLVREVELNEDGAITGFIETSSWEDVNAVLIDNSRCIRCGECVRVCPMDCISVTRVELVEKRGV